MSGCPSLFIVGIPTIEVDVLKGRCSSAVGLPTVIPLDRSIFEHMLDSRRKAHSVSPSNTLLPSLEGDTHEKVCAFGCRHPAVNVRDVHRFFSRRWVTDAEVLAGELLTGVCELTQYLHLT